MKILGRGASRLGMRCAWLLALLSTSVLPLAASDRGRLSGTVVDQSGNPVADVTLEFVSPEAVSVSMKPVTTDKKGRFTVVNFPPGARRIELRAPDLRIERMVIDVRGPDGSRIGRLEEEARPGILLSPFEVGVGQRVAVQIVVGPGESEPRQEVTLAAAVETSGVLKKLNALFEQDDMEQLLVETERVLAEEPDLGGALYLRAVALWRTKRFQEAETTMRRAVELIPDQPGIRGTLGSILLDYGDHEREAGRDEAATALYERAVEALGEECRQGGDSVTFLTNWVIALERSGRPEEATEALKQLIEMDPDNPRARMRLAELLTDMGRVEEALGVLDEMPPDDNVAAAMFNAAFKLYDAGELDPAVAWLEKVVKISPELPEAHQLLGRALMAQGDYEGATRELKEFLRLAPDDPTAQTDRDLVKAMENK